MKSWGFCSDECFLDESVADTGILRLKDNIHVLPEKLCDKYLEYSLEQKPEVKESQEKEQSSNIPQKVRPHIMCVANQNKWKEEVYEKKGDGYR